MTDELGELGFVAETPAGVRNEAAELIDEARRLPEMPPYVDYSPLLADIAAWVEALQGCTATVAAASAEAGEATATARSQLDAADQADGEGLHRLTWLSQQCPAVEKRLAAVGDKLAPASTPAVAALEGLREQIETSFMLSLTKPPLAEVAATRDAALGALAVSLGEQGFSGVVSFSGAGLVGRGSRAPCMSA